MITRSDNFQLDNSTMDKGYVVVTLLNNKNKIRHKVLVTKENNKLYYEFYEDTIQIPLQFGAGLYKFQNYRNTSGQYYTPAGFLSLNAIKIDPEAYMLSSNQLVHCDEVEEIIPKIPVKETKQEQFAAIKEYIKSHFAYDYIKQAIMKKSPLPNIPECILKKKGICYDLASLATAVCRKFGIKAAMIIGTSSGIGLLRGAHAWVKVYIDGEEILYDPTADVAKKKMARDYKEERRY